MINKQHILERAREWQLRPEVVEKDYVLGWLLAAVAQHEETAQQWVFKGGTCVKKCFFETYRFSEDLDFSMSCRRIGGSWRAWVGCSVISGDTCARQPGAVAVCSTRQTSPVTLRCRDQRRIGGSTWSRHPSSSTPRVARRSVTQVQGSRT